jgi:hypothetical protein
MDFPGIAPFLAAVQTYLKAGRICHFRSGPDLAFESCPSNPFAPSLASARMWAPLEESRFMTAASPRLPITVVPVQTVERSREPTTIGGSCGHLLGSWTNQFCTFVPGTRISPRRKARCTSAANHAPRSCNRSFSPISAKTNSGARPDNPIAFPLSIGNLASVFLRWATPEVNSAPVSRIRLLIAAYCGLSLTLR